MLFLPSIFGPIHPWLLFFKYNCSNPLQASTFSSFLLPYSLCQSSFISSSINTFPSFLHPSLSHLNFFFPHYTLQSPLDFVSLRWSLSISLAPAWTHILTLCHSGGGDIQYNMVAYHSDALVSIQNTFNRYCKGTKQ